MAIGDWVKDWFNSPFAPHPTGIPLPPPGGGGGSGGGAGGGYGDYTTPASAYSWSSIAQALEQAKQQPRITQPVSQPKSQSAPAQQQSTQQQPAPGPGEEGTTSSPTFPIPEYKAPEIPTYSLQEMMDIVQRRVDLLTREPLEQLQRTLEEERLGGERRKGEIESAYRQAIQELEQMGHAYQRAGAETMRRRGLYDSGMAAGLANQIQREVIRAGGRLEEEQARQLADLAEYLHLRERHTNEQIQSLMGQKAQWAEALLEEMRMKERDRKDRMEQQAFENWLAQQAMNFEIARANWETAFQTQQADWQRKQTEAQSAWDRAMEQQRLALQQPAYQLQQENLQMAQDKRRAMENLLKYGFGGLSDWDKYLLWGYNPNEIDISKLSPEERQALAEKLMDYL